MSKTARQAITAVFGKHTKKEWEAMRAVDMLTFGRMAATELGCDLKDEAKWEKKAEEEAEEAAQAA
jgi:hypothetical protein